MFVCVCVCEIAVPFGRGAALGTVGVVSHSEGVGGGVLFRSQRDNQMRRWIMR